MGEKIFLGDLTPGWEGEVTGLVLSLSLGRTNRGSAYLNLELGDRSGRMTAKVWDRAEELAEKLPEGSVALVRGRLESYRGSPQLIVSDARTLTQTDLNWNDYLKVSARPAEEMKAELFRLIDALPDPDWRRLVEAALKDPETAARFFLAPAAKNLHHARIHGLLEHSLSVGRLAALAAGRYPRLNPGLLIAGALLHDLGKVWELSPPPRTDYTTWGRLKGHAALGTEFLRRLAGELGNFPEEKLALLEHLILSHHGEPEFGAAVRPQLLEAIALHYLDNLDAKLDAVETFMDEGVDAEGWSPYHRLFSGYFRRTPAFGSPEDETGPARTELNRAAEEAPGSGEPDSGEPDSDEPGSDEPGSDEPDSDERRLF